MPWWTELSSQERSAQLLDDIRAAEELAAMLPPNSRDRTMIEVTIADLVRELEGIAEERDGSPEPDQPATGEVGT
jgi:hypothetical protein